MKSSVRSVVLTELGELVDLTPAWRRLWTASPDVSTFQHPGWVLPWLRHYQANRPLCVVALKDDTDDTVVGLAPLLLDLPSRQLQFIGHPLNDRNGVLALPGLRAAVWRSVAARLGARSPAGCQLPEMDDAEVADCMSAGLGCRRSAAAPSPLIRLPSAWPVYYQRLSAGRRRAWRRATRQLAEHGAVHFEWLAGSRLPGDELRAFHRDRLQRFAVAERLPELSVVERSPAFGDFLADVADELAAEGLLQLGRLWAGDCRAAQNLYLSWPGVTLDYMQTFTPALGACSPGMLALLAGIERCIAAGAPVFDFGRGDEAYKFVLGAEPRLLGGVEG